MTIVTVQLFAVYVVPVVPYVALTTFPLDGPKSVPVSVMVEPPAVPMALPLGLPIAVIAGGV